MKRPDGVSFYPATVYVEKFFRLRSRRRKVEVYFPEGFDWEKYEPVIEKMEEELQEFKNVLKEGKKDEIEKEFGDLLFTLVNISRFLKITSEDALQKTNRKFINRFNCT